MFYAFDILWDEHARSDDETEMRRFRNGEDVRYLPLIGRKLRLRALVPKYGERLLFCDHIVVSRRNPWYEYAAAATAGSVIGAYLTFRVARKAGRAYLDSKFGRQLMPKLLNIFDRWGMGVVVASCAIPFPLPTSMFFAAAGASGKYHTAPFLTAVALARGFRYTAVAIVAHLYGRHVIRVLRHPTQYWGWLILFSAIFVLLIVTGVLINRRVVEASG